MEEFLKGMPNRTKATPRVLEDLIGARFGRLEVIFYAGRHLYAGDKQKRRVWLCMCDCGRLTATTTTRLVCGYCKSCGCISMEKRRDPNAPRRKHRAKSQEANRKTYLRRLEKLRKSRPQAYAGYDPHDRIRW